jgi:uncharacterized protein YciI
MLYTILCSFGPGAFSRAKELRLEHYEFLRRVKNSIVEGGPLLGVDGIPTAMLMVIERETFEEAKAFISEEPYTKSGLFESVSIRCWKQVMPEPVPDFINSEYEKELAARQSAKVT